MGNFKLSGWSKRVEGVVWSLGLVNKIVSAPDFRWISVKKRVDFENLYRKVVYLKIAQLGGPIARVQGKSVIFLFFYFNLLDMSDK